MHSSAVAIFIAFHSVDFAKWTAPTIWAFSLVTVPVEPRWSGWSYQCVLPVRRDPHFLVSWRWPQPRLLFLTPHARG